MCRGRSYRPALGLVRPLLLSFSFFFLLACPQRGASGDALSGEGAGPRDCWERGRGDFEEVAWCLLELLRALQQRPSAAGAVGGRGLMQEVARNDEAGVPGFQDLPWIGNAFKSNDDERDVIELVIFLKATIVPAPIPDPADIDLYATFALDPRPLTF